MLSGDVSVKELEEGEEDSSADAWSVRFLGVLLESLSKRVLSEHEVGLI